jgi:hypothetical protein
MFYLGQRVVCVDDQFPVEAFELYDHVPVAGETYTIRCFVHGFDCVKHCWGVGVLLNEIINAPDPATASEAPFGQWHFRPLEGTMTETGSEMLLPQRIKSTLSNSRILLS